MHNRVKIALGAILLAALHQGALPCTGFLIKNGNRATVSFNFDFQFGAGHIYINKRNTERRRFLMYAEKPIRWISKYGSITFNLVGRDWPHDGMNEAGVVILSMGLDDTKFQRPDDRLPIDENGWIQYQLDNSASIEDVLENMKKVRISNRSIGDSHFLIVDSTGKALVVEYLDGHQVTYGGNKLPYPILANDTYSHMLEYLNQQKTFGGVQEEEFRVGSSRCRFTRVADRLRHFDASGDSMIDYGIGLLDEMKQSNTQYQVVYDVMGRAIYYRSRNTNELKLISFSEFDFRCSSPVLMMDIQSALSGKTRDAFGNYDPGRSKLALVEFNKNTFEYFPEQALAALAGASVNSKCLDEESHVVASDAKKERGEETLRSDAVVASLHKPEQDRIFVLHDGDKVSLNLDVELNRPAKEDIDFVIEVPDSSGLKPGTDVFIVPNPVRIEKGKSSASVRAIIVPGSVKKGIDKYLIANLVSDGAHVANGKQFRVQVRSGVKSE